MKLSHKLIMVSVAALMGIGAIAPETANNNFVQAAKKKTTKAAKTDQIILGHNSYVYFSNGKRNKNYKVGKKKYPVIGKGAKLSSYGVKMINDAPYYFIGNGNYIKAANIAKLNGKKVTVKDAEKAIKKVTTKSITLTHNAYVYNSKGKRIKSAGTLKKNSVINYVGTKKIKGKNYYNLGKGRYVKTANAKVRKASTTETTVVNKKDKDTYIRIVTNSTIYNNKAVAYPESDSMVAVKGADYKAMSAKKIDGQWYYQIGSNQYIKAVNAYVVDGPALITDPSYTEPKPADNSVNTIVTLKNTAPTYNIKGQVVNNNSFGAGQALRVSSAIWIWVPAENQAVEFYKIASDSSSYIRVDDVDLVSGKQLTPNNTPEEARDNAVIATSSDKASLKDLLSQASTIKNSAKYKFSSKEARDEFDSAINNGNLIMASTSATIANVKIAIQALNQAESDLNGSKITVADINNLSTNERDAVVKLAAKVNGVSEDDVSLINGAQSVQINNLNGSSKVDPITEYVN